ncbi:MAG: glycogen-binding domain-containing protein [Victivallales bacterium]|nr:glycogen-binding domain-containing protein [Victivallales bacterium]
MPRKESETTKTKTVTRKKTTTAAKEPKTVRTRAKKTAAAAPVDAENVKQPVESKENGKMLKNLTDNSRTHSVKFVKEAEVGSQVYLAGDFNNWNTTDYPLVDRYGKGEYAISIPLEPGCYQYKFVVNGIWCMDDNNPEVVISPLGTFNNVVVVKD